MFDSSQFVVPSQVQVFQGRGGVRKFSGRGDHCDDILHADDFAGEVIVGMFPFIFCMQVI